MQMPSKSHFLWLLILGAFTLTPLKGHATEGVQTWTVVNPSGVVEEKFFKPAPRLSSLEGKTIVLRWNEKHNGDNFLNRIAELLKEKVPSANVVKLYEVDPSTVKISGSASESVRIAQAIKNLKADIVIAAQTD